MAGYNKFQDFVEQLGKGTHQLHAAGHTLNVYLSNEAPINTDTVKTDIAEITTGNGYTGAKDANNDYSESAGVGTLTCSDVSWTASGGAFGPFRYAILYNSNASDRLIAWWDYGSSISCNDGESFTVDFGANVFTIT